MATHMYKQDLFEIGTAIIEICSARKEHEQSIFLCGGKLNSTCVRSFFYNNVKDIDGLAIKFPEGLFDEILEENLYDLLTLEELLANSVDAIVIFPESPGSFVELGAFTKNRSLREKMICVMDVKHKHDFSFINLGPIRILKNTIKEHKNHLFYVSYKKLNNRTECVQLFKKNLQPAIRKIKGKHRENRTLQIFDIEEIIIASLFCVESLTWANIYDMYTEENTKIPQQKLKGVIDICLRMLMTSKKVQKNKDGSFCLSKNIVLSLMDIPENLMLHKLRVAAMHCYLRRHARFSYDTLKKTPL